MRIKDFANIIWFFLISIFVTVIVPGSISALNKTFYKESLQSLIPADQKDRINAFQRQEDGLAMIRNDFSFSAYKDANTKIAYYATKV